jgi:hypothetical protein
MNYSRHLFTWTFDVARSLVLPPQMLLVLRLVLGLEPANDALGILYVLMFPPHVLLVSVLAVKGPLARDALKRLQLGVHRRHVPLQRPPRVAAKAA